MKFWMLPEKAGLAALERERKFYFSVTVFLVVTLLIAFDKLAGETYGEIVIWVSGLFMAGNVGEHAAKALSSRSGGEK